MWFHFAWTVIYLTFCIKKMVITNEYIQSCLSIDQLKYGEDALQATFFNKNLSLIRVIQSLNYPNQYPKEIHCVFLIYGTINYLVNYIYIPNKHYLNLNSS